MEIREHTITQANQIGRDPARNFSIHDRGKGRERYKEENADTAQKNVMRFAMYWN